MKWIIISAFGLASAWLLWFIRRRINAKQIWLRNAIRDDNIDEFKAIIGDVKRYEAKHSKERPLLHRAAESGAASIVLYLVEQGCDVNAVDTNGITALMLAAPFAGGSGEYDFGRSRTLRILLNVEANVNAKSNKGRTALMYVAARSVHPAAVLRLLIQNGANARESDAYGMTAGLYWFKFREHHYKNDMWYSPYKHYKEDVRGILLAAGDQSIKSDAEIDRITKTLKTLDLNRAFRTMGGILNVDIE